MTDPIVCLKPSYYFMATFGYRAPWKRYITQMQILQFFTVFMLINTFFIVDYLVVPFECCGSKLVAFCSQAVNVLYLSLFVKFYLKQYSTTPKKKV